MKVSLLYNPNDKGINGNNWKLNNRRFFIDELSKHVELNFSSVVSDFDCNDGIKSDAVIIWSLLEKNFTFIDLGRLKGLDYTMITRAPDAWEIDKGYNQRCKELGIDLVVSFQSPKCQYDFLDKNIRYERFILGIDEKTYPNPDNWDERAKAPILSSGVLDTRWWFYRFRALCAEHPFVQHIPKKDFLGVDYWKLLTHYRAAIACMSYTSVLKYFEIPMCGCLMFAEVTDFNQIRDMGFIDGVNCVYINDLNYKKKFKEYWDTPDDPKWKRIADSGHKLVKNTYNNESEVRRFVKLIESMAAAKLR
jgi:hypothetical protein